MNKTSGTGGAILRFFQFASAVLVMSLMAYALHNYDYFGSTRANFGLAVGVIGTFYIICVIILVAILPQVVMVGPYLIAECIMCLLWLCAFIVLAKVFGQHSCGSFYVTPNYNPSFGSFTAFQNARGRVNPFTNQYTANQHTTACRSAKTAIAFAGLSFVLFVISCIMLGVNVVMPIVNAHGGLGMWKTGGYLGTRLHRWSGLGLTSSVVNPQQTYGGPTDLEQQEAMGPGVGTTGTTTTAAGTTAGTGAGYGAGYGAGTGAGYAPEQRTMSSGESGKSESPNASGEPKFSTQPDRTAGMTP